MAARKIARDWRGAPVADRAFVATVHFADGREPLTTTVYGPHASGAEAAYTAAHPDVAFTIVRRELPA